MFEKILTTLLAPYSALQMQRQGRPFRRRHVDGEFIHISVLSASLMQPCWRLTMLSVRVFLHDNETLVTNDIAQDIVVSFSMISMTGLL